MEHVKSIKNYTTVVAIIYHDKEINDSKYTCTICSKYTCIQVYMNKVSIFAEHLNYSNSYIIIDLGNPTIKLVMNSFTQDITW